MAARGPAENQLNNFKKTVKVCTDVQNISFFSLIHDFFDNQFTYFFEFGVNIYLGFVMNILVESFLDFAIIS